jgi:nucleoside-diphosphate-sugar epimerase
MRLFVTGANGFVGSNLCRHFRAKGWEVYGLVRPTADLHFLDGLGVELVVGDLCDPGSFVLPEGLDFVVHAAAITSDTAGDDACRRNILEPAINLAAKIEALAPGPRRVIVISTALVLGFAAAEISEERPGRSAEFISYTRFKIESEKYFLSRWREAGLPVVVLRPGDIFGPNDRVTCGRLLKAIERGAPAVVGNGRSRFGYCFVGNLVQAVDLALAKEGIEGRAYTVTNGRLPTWGEFFGGLQAALGRKQRLYVPAWAGFAAAGLMAGIKKLRPGFEPPLNYYRIKRIVTETTYDISRTVADLGYAPDDDVARQIREIVDWYRSEKSHGHIK